MPGADGMSTKFMKSAFVGWTFTAGLYYPPDFDSTKLMPLKHLRPKGQTQAMNIRMMFPFTMICDACGEYNYTGTKFTARVEEIKHEMYLGIKVYRFYGRCRHCFAEFTFKTDPKNSDYTMESGGKRTYEAWKDADMVEAQLKAEKEKEAAQDQMKALEQKSVDVQAEMQRLEDLDALRTMNKRLGARDQTIEEALEFLFKKNETDDRAQKALHKGDLEELQAYREAQQERKRQHLDDEVEGEASPSDGAGGSSSSASSSTLSGAPAGASGPTAASAQGAAIAAAVAERAKQSGARGGARAGLSVKRKAPEASPAASPEAEGPAVAKRPCSGSGAPAAAAEVPSAPAAAAGAEGGAAASGGALGSLGTYDSDSS